MNFIKFFHILLLLVEFCIFQSCQPKVESHNLNTIDELGENYVLKSTINVFESLPGPVETTELIKKSGVSFSKKVMNPSRNAKYYETSFTQALNIGIYCADLSYSIHYEQKQVTLEYFEAIKLLANKLNLISLVTNDDITYVEDNLYNTDTIKQFVKQVFYNSGEKLNDNKRPEIALLVEVGGWVEGLYLAINMAKHSGMINEELVDCVAQQRKSLTLLVESLENFANIESINYILKDLKKLKNIYDQMFIDEDKPIDTNITIDFAVETKAVVTPKIFLELFNQITSIRNTYTQ